MQLKMSQAQLLIRKQLKRNVTPLVRLATPCIDRGCVKQSVVGGHCQSNLCHQAKPKYRVAQEDQGEKCDRCSVGPILRIYEFNCEPHFL